MKPRTEKALSLAVRQIGDAIEDAVIGLMIEGLDSSVARSEVLDRLLKSVGEPGYADSR